MCEMASKNEESAVPTLKDTPGADIFAKLFDEKDEYEAALKEWYEAFALFDTEASGLISHQDMASIIRQLGYNPREADIETWISKYGNDEKKISLESFFRILKQNIDRDNIVESLELAFDVLDPNKKGYLNVDELKTLVTSKGEVMSPEEFDEIMKEFNVGFDGSIKRKDVMGLASRK